jgi:hypothetical protein
MVLFCMDKSRAAKVVCIFIVFSLFLSPNSVGQAVNTSITVLSYSSYISQSGHFVVLGEVQNTCSHTLESVSLDVVVSASDGSQIAADTTDVLIKNFLPQQKAPFYLDFGKIDFDIVSKTSMFNISLSNAPPTNYEQYPNLALIVAFNGILNDVYTVSGSITNIGNQTANDVKIEGTYYNNVGVVVGVGLVTLKDSLTPNSSANFTLSQFDASPNIVTKISNYSLLVQTSTQVFSLPPTTSPSGKAQSANSSLLTLGIISIVSISIIVALTLVLLRRRHLNHQQNKNVHTSHVSLS